MWAILDPQGKHGHADLFLRLFLKFLREQHHVNVREADYTNATIFREQGRVDLLICDKQSGKAIIVENKINGANDMDRQVVRYLETVENSWEYECDSIIYLCLDRKKEPDKHGWTEVEKQKVKPLLRVICAYDDTDGDLFKGWLLPCLNGSKDDEVAHILRQYRQMILKLGRNAMNRPIMEEFYQLMCDKNRFDSANSLMAIMNDLPAFRCQKIVELCQHDDGPFTKLWFYNPVVAVFEGFGIGNIKIHVDTSLPKTTKVQFWNNVDDDPEGKLPRRILQDLGMVGLFSEEDGWFTKEFEFPDQEEELYQFVSEFKSKLKAYSSSAVFS
jgi:hypothetical protein